MVQLGGQGGVGGCLGRGEGGGGGGGVGRRPAEVLGIEDYLHTTLYGCKAGRVHNRRRITSTVNCIARSAALMIEPTASDDASSTACAPAQ